MENLIEFINMTPHSIMILDENNALVREFPASGKLIRLTTKTINLPALNGIKITKTIFGEAEGLPEFKQGIYYIVSQMIKSSLLNRKDLLVPTDMVRDNKGNILGCKSLGV